MPRHHAAVGAKGRALLLTCVVVSLFALALPGPVAAACTSTTVSWTGAGGDGKWETAANWQDNCGMHHVPASTDNVQIELNGTYIVSLSSATSVNSLTIGTTTTTGSQILLISGGGSLATTTSIQVGGRGAITLDSTAGASLSAGSTLSNAGTITTQGSAGTPQLAGNLTNTGTLQINRNTTITENATPATLLNEGTIAISSVAKLTADSTVTVTNATGGQINGTGTGALSSSGTFNQADGTTTTPSPAVLIDGGTLNYIGSGASSIQIEATAALSGTTQSGQSLRLVGNNVVATAASGFTNGGSLTLDGGSGAVTLSVGSNTLTNSGTLTTQGTAGVPTLAGNVTNTGTLPVNATTNLVKGGGSPETLLNEGMIAIGSAATLSADATATVRQTSGTTTIASSGNLDVSATGGGFTLSGGTLNGAGTVSGSVTNIGGTVHPGTSPGILTISGNYLQASGGTLEIDIEGTTPGVGFSRLSVGSTATLDGTLHTNTTGQQSGIFRVLTAGARSGTFSSLTASGERYSAAYDATGVTLTALAWTLSVTKNGSGTGTVSSSPAGINCGSTCSAGYVDSAMVTLTAKPDSGSMFVGWSGGGCSGTGPCQVTMSQDQAVTATFTKIYPLTVSKRGRGAGRVTSSPSGINCGSTCGARYNAGTTVILTAAASKGSSFAGWRGACSGTGTCRVMLTGAVNVTASFAKQAPNTKVTKARISAKNHTASISFVGIGKTTGFGCALVRTGNGKKSPKASFRRCTSPKTYKHLKAGKYTFLVRAVNGSRRDPTPAQSSFTI